MLHRFKWTKVSHRRNWISREYEPLQPYFLLELAQAAGARTFVDVGANVGLYSVLMSRAVDRVVAFEANRSLAEEVRANLLLNGVEGTVRCVAVSESAGRVTFGIVSRYAGNSAVLDDERSEDAYSSTTSVEAVTLDDELAALDGPLVLKIDVEGHEHSVLSGADRTLRRKKCIVQIESFDNKVDAFLSSRNYRRLTSIGPDGYFTNIDGLDPLACYERSTAAMIEANHEVKSMSFGRGGIALVVSGKIYEAVRGGAQKVLRGRL